MDACVRIPALADSLPSPCCLVVGLESADELAHTREAEQAWPCCPGSILRSAYVVDAAPRRSGRTIPNNNRHLCQCLGAVRVARD